MEREKSLPNIILFVADELRGDCISLGGKRNSIINTPNIDKFAQDGVAFTNCFTVNPVCGPSRCCTFTGQYVHSNNHRSLYQLLQPHEDNLFKFLKDKGYTVILVGRNDLFTKKAIKGSISKRIRIKPRMIKTNPYPLEHSMRKSFYFGIRTEEEAKDIDYNITQEAINYLKSNPGKPFCLFIALGFPHPPYTVEEPFFSMYDRENVPSPIPPKLEDKPEFMRLIHERYGLNNLDKGDFKEIIATYYGMVSRVDHQFGLIINQLKEIGVYENSAIAFFADHGDFLGDYGLTEKWPTAFQDCLLNIPLILKIPGIERKNVIYDQLVQSIDIFPTIMHIAQVSTQYTHFGKNLIPLLQGHLTKVRNAVFAEGGHNPREPQCFEPVIASPELPGIGIYYDKTNIPKEDSSTVARSAMIRTKLWKLIIRDQGKEELYDLMYDPNEANNLIDIYAYDKVKTDLKEQLLRWYLRTSDNADWKRERNV